MKSTTPLSVQSYIQSDETEKYFQMFLINKISMTCMVI